MLTVIQGLFGPAGPVDIFLPWLAIVAMIDFAESTEQFTIRLTVI